MAKPAREHFEGYRCPDCDKLFTEAESESPLYECTCGEQYSRDNSADGSSNRCPGCNKFGAKLSDVSCPDGCSSEPEQAKGERCTKCDRLDDGNQDDCDCDDEEVIAAMPEDDLSRLPKWARERIERAERALAEERKRAQRDLAADADPLAVVVDPIQDHIGGRRALRLPRGSEVLFRLDERSCAYVKRREVEPGRWALDVRGEGPRSGQLSVHPHSGNLVLIRVW